MKKIIVHGTIEKNKTKKFKCLECGCVFETSDYSDYFTSPVTSRILSNCPECGKVTAEIKRSITYRDKLRMEHPEMVDSTFLGGCAGCPSYYGYESNRYCTRKSVLNCAECWDREISD